jgi:hypothetical protein
VSAQRPGQSACCSADKFRLQQSVLTRTVPGQQRTRRASPKAGALTEQCRIRYFLDEPGLSRQSSNSLREHPPSGCRLALAIPVDVHRARGCVPLARRFAAPAASPPARPCHVRGLPRGHLSLSLRYRPRASWRAGTGKVRTSQSAPPAITSRSLDPRHGLAEQSDKLRDGHTQPGPLRAQSRHVPPCRHGERAASAATHCTDTEDSMLGPDRHPRS